MTKILIYLFVIIMPLSIKAQDVNKQDEGQRLAKKIAKNLKDSLNLTGTEMNKLYDINMYIQNQKKQVRLKYSDRTVIQTELQRIEKSRDSLYRLVIPVEKFDAYKRKKRNLVNNNQ